MCKEGNDCKKDIDKRFDAYMSLYNNLDTLLWRIPTQLIGITVISIGLFGEKLAKPDCSFLFLTHIQSLGVASLIIGLLYALGAFSMWRIRYHHDICGNELKKMEPSGYFHPRAQMIKRKWLSAPHLFIRIFTLLAIILIFIGLILLFKKEGQEMGKINTEDLASYGIILNHEKMENGELRFRLMGKDGSGYIRTVAGKQGAWQNSHYHKQIMETYIVQSGWMALAELLNGKLKLHVLRPGEIVTTKPGVVHNIYLPKGAVIHTVKHGKCTAEDWNPSEEFDKQTKKISEKEIFQMINKTENTS